MRKTILLLFILSKFSFSQEYQFKNIPVDSVVSYRGLSVIDDSTIWISGTKGTVGISINGGNKWDFKKVKGFEKLDFRSLYAFDNKTAIIANAGSPAYILRTTDAGNNWKIVYENKDSSAFFDGVDFWNDKEGIIYGDPIKGKMLLLKTIDGGITWQEFAEQSRPILAEGEASFAASGTGIRCYGKKKVIISTGGKVSRLLVSDNKGKKWNELKVPIIQGKSSTGVFSVAFLNSKNGIVVGGDFLIDTLKTKHVFYTIDAGKNWLFPTSPTGGYRECVEFITKNIAIAVGPEGADISFDSGKNWKHFVNEKSFHVIKKARRGNLIVAAGNKKISLIEAKK